MCDSVLWASDTTCPCCRWTPAVSLPWFHKVPNPAIGVLLGLNWPEDRFWKPPHQEPSLTGPRTQKNMQRGEFLRPQKSPQFHTRRLEPPVSEVGLNRAVDGGPQASPERRAPAFLSLPCPAAQFAPNPDCSFMGQNGPDGATPKVLSSSLVRHPNLLVHKWGHSADCKCGCPQAALGPPATPTVDTPAQPTPSTSSA